MRKKLISLIIATAVILSLTTTTFAATPDAPTFSPRFRSGFARYSLATDDNGNLVSRDVFEANLDKAVADGVIRAEDKAFIQEMFDYRVANGGLAFGRSCGRFGGPGFGRFRRPGFGRGFAAPNN